jgi:hypothetical protein
MESAKLNICQLERSIRKYLTSLTKYMMLKRLRHIGRYVETLGLILSL